jgi:hypothetical protein
VHVERAERLPALHDEVADLVRVVSRCRWRLGLERLLIFGIRGLIASALLVIVVALAAWLLAGWVVIALDQAVWLSGLPLVAALGLALVRWPSGRQAALAADRRLVLDERLGTAIEIAERARGGGGGRFDRLQVRDAVARASAAPGAWLALDRRVRGEALVAAAMCVIAGCTLVLLPNVPRPSLPLAPPGPAAVDAPSEEPDRAVLADAVEPDAPKPQPVPQAQVAADPDLAARVQQEQGQREALDTLSHALGQVSAAQPAADAIQQGDFSAAKQQLSNLGDEADQLSDAAKQQLSKALQQAANSTPGDRPLADRERQAAQAMSRSTYTEQRQALHNLADQLERSGERAVSADQLAHDQGQLQQQAPGQPSAGQQPNGQRAGQAPASPAGAKSQGTANAGEGAPAGAQQGAADGGQGAGAPGQQGGPGVGTGADQQPLADQASRLDTAGQSVSVPAKLGSGPGVRPPDGTEDQIGRDPTTGGKSVSELVQSQQTGQVAPEQNLVPGEQRPVVRGYFR